MNRAVGLSPSTIGLTTIFHVTTPKKAQRYHNSGCILAPVRGFENLMAAMAWGLKTGRTVIYAIEIADRPAYMMPDHHNRYGCAWWINEDVPLMDARCVFSAEKDA